jgi:hypothetical protein
MDYGNLFSKAWDIIWKNKFLILLGVLVALGSSNFGGSTPSQYTFSGDEFDWQNFPQIDYGAPFQDFDLPFLAVGGIALFVFGLFLVGLVLWALATISRGGLISAVNEIELGNPTNFSEAFKAGWGKGWRLIGIELVTAIPGLILFLVGVATFFMFGGYAALSQGDFDPVSLSIFLPLLVLTCILVPVMIILSLLSAFAFRACMLEDQPVFAAYKRGFEVLGDNLGPAILLFILLIALSVVIGIIMFIPGFLMALCCLLWPVLLLIEGAFMAFYSTLWTLAWREWTLISEK